MSTTERKLYVTKKWVLAIFLYYVVLFFIGLYYTVATLLKTSPGESVINVALIGSMSISITASSIAYIRKLYKLCFKYSTEQESDDQVQLKKIGTMVYFFTRPIFALLFSVLIVVGLNSGMLASTKKMELDQGFIYITMFFSFYAGFLSGDFIKKLEKDGKKHFGELMK